MDPLQLDLAHQLHTCLKSQAGGQQPQLMPGKMLPDKSFL